MKLIRLLSFVLVSAFAVSAFAAPKEVELNGSQAALGDLGDIRDIINIQNNGDYTLVRTEKTAAKVELLLQVKEPQTICAKTEIQYYPCGCNGGYGYPRPPRPYPYPNPYPYPYPYPNGCGMCAQTVCVKYEQILVTRTKNIKLNFKKAEKIEAGQDELFDLKIRSNGYNLNYELNADNNYKVKKTFGKFFKIKKQ